MSLSEDHAAAVGFEIRTFLHRFDRMRSAMDSWTADLDFDDQDEVRIDEHDRKHDEVLLTQDAALVSALRLIGFFLLEGPHEPEELAPTALLPGWEPPAASAAQLRSYVEGMTAAATTLSDLNTEDWPFAAILAAMLDVAKSFSWGLGAYDPAAAQHFDHNLAELRARLQRGVREDGGSLPGQGGGATWRRGTSCPEPPAATLPKGPSVHARSGCGRCRTTP